MPRLMSLVFGMRDGNGSIEFRGQTQGARGMPRLMSLVFGMRDSNGSIELEDRCREQELFSGWGVGCVG